MKNTVLILVFLAVFTSLSAQTSDTTGKAGKSRGMAIDFSAGWSMAMGSYASDDKNAEKTGYASNGFLVQLGFSWMGKKDFGLGIQYTFQQNPLLDTASRLVIEGTKNSMLGPGSWTNHYLLVGPVFMRSFGKLFVEARLMGGAVVSVSPCFSTQDPGDTTHLTSNLAPGFAWEFSAGAGYTVSKHFSFKLNLGLMGGWPVARKQYPSKLIGYEKYKDPITGITYDLPVYSAPIEYVIKKVITTFNPSIGFVYRF